MVRGLDQTLLAPSVSPTFLVEENTQQNHAPIRRARTVGKQAGISPRLTCCVRGSASPDPSPCNEIHTDDESVSAGAMVAHYRCEFPVSGGTIHLKSGCGVKDSGNGCSALHTSKRVYVYVSPHSSHWTKNWSSRVGRGANASVGARGILCVM